MGANQTKLTLCGDGTMQQGGKCIGSAGASDSLGGLSGSTNANGGSEAGTSAVGGSRPDGGSAGEAGAGDFAGEVDSPAGAGGVAGGGAGGGGTPGMGGAQDQGKLLSGEVDCGSRDVTGATVVTEPITQDTTWSGVVHLPNGVSIRNEPTLTIQPGTKIIVGSKASVEVGWMGSHATIMALGTVDQPIKFCGETGAVGYWAGLVVRPGVKNESILRNVLIADAGATTAGLLAEMPLNLQGVEVRNSGGYGVSAVGFGSSSSTLTVVGAAKSSVQATAPKGVEVPPSSALTGNGTDAIDIAFAGYDTDVTLRDNGVPYRQLTDAKTPTLSPAPVVTVQPGVVYQIAGKKLLDLNNATAHVVGTLEKPILFEGLPCTQAPLDCSSNPSPNEFAVGGRISLQPGSASEIRFVELRKLAGSSTSTAPAYDAFGALTVTTIAPITVQHLTITGTGGYGLRLSGPFSSTSSGITSNAALLLDCNGIQTLPADTLHPQTATVADCGGATGAQIWPLSGSPYLLGEFGIDDGGSLSPQPGTTLRFRQNATITVHSGGTLTALGTTNAVITFTADAPPWTGIRGQAGSAITLDHVLISHAGSTVYDAFTPSASIVATDPITLTHSTIDFSASYGLRHAATDTTNYASGNVFSNNAFGDITTLN